MLVLLLQCIDQTTPRMTGQEILHGFRGGSSVFEIQPRATARQHHVRLFVVVARRRGTLAATDLGQIRDRVRSQHLMRRRRRVWGGRGQVAIDGQQAGCRGHGGRGGGRGIVLGQI